MATYRAAFGDVEIARTDHPVLLEGNVYFPPDSVRAGCLTRTRRRSLCPWKGVAGYFTVSIDGVVIGNVAWTYRHPLPLARRIKYHVAFGSGVSVTEVPRAPTVSGAEAEPVERG